MRFMALHAVHGVVVGLADDRPRHAREVGHAHHLGDLPASDIADAPVADLALADQVSHDADDLLDRRHRIVEMQVVDVDVAEAEALQAVLGRLHHPAPSPAAAIRPERRQARAHLGRDQPMAAVGLDRAADDPLGLAAGIGVGRVDHVAAGVARLADDA
jgi:hypothetical protein